MRAVELKKGQRFGAWTVIERAENNPYGASRWLCRCDCGTVKALQQGSLRGGHSGSCGCKGLFGGIKQGARFGSVTIVKRTTNGANEAKRWLCKCDCGGTKEITGTYLTSARNVSCGCKGGKGLFLNGRHLGPTKLAALSGFKESMIYRRLRKCQGEPTIKEILGPLKRRRKSKH